MNDWKKPPSYSSYEQNNYGELFYALMRIYQPEKVVELGTRTGYSAYHIARGLKANGRGTLDCYDLWDSYVGNYGFDSIKSVAEENLKEFKNIISLKATDAIGVDKGYEMIDILHVDLDNEGGILEKIVPVWIDKTRQFIIIEGGSLERDKIGLSQSIKMPINQWLEKFNNVEAEVLKKIIPDPIDKTRQFVIVEGDTKYKKMPIAQWLEKFSDRRKDIEYLTIEPFPSVTIIRKK